jgi:hypothetical protein
VVELDKQNIYFVAARWEKVGEPPEVAAKSLPDWYKDADRYHDNGNSTFRNCVPFFDAMTSGYIFKTPCDIMFQHDEDRITAYIEDPQFQYFVGLRDPLPGFHHPEGYYPEHFSFLPEWGVSLDSGFSALYTTPFNRFDLPFVVTTGIIDNDKMNTPGMIPFFVKTGFSGLLPKGTPYLQVIPFRREEWVSTPMFGTEAQIGRNLKRSIKFRSVQSDFYRDNLWQRKKYRSQDSVNLETTEGETDV